MVGRILYHENQRRLADLADGLLAGLSGTPPALAALEGFLAVVEEHPELHDADKLVFRDTLAEVAETLRATPAAGAAIVTRVEADQAALAEIQALYDAEIQRIFGRFETRGMTVRREAWERYVAHLRTLVSAASILEEYRSEVAAVEAPRRRLAASSGPPLETSGLDLPVRTLVLTFDDGPHPRYTDRILAILKEQGVKAVFFEVGENIGRATQGGGLRATRAASASRHVREAGHTVANHTYSHELLTKLADKGVADQIDWTDRVLRRIVGADAPALFRPPYGAGSERVLAALAARAKQSVLWNIDSKDWADPVPLSIANRVIRGIEGERHGIILFHDIQARTIDALPLVIETAKAKGYRFLAWDGSGFVDETPPPVQKAAPEPPPPPEPEPYRQSWAVVVGIDAYQHWPRLSYAVNDARAIRELLERKFRFQPDHITMLLNEEATRERILAALGDDLANPAKVTRDDRVFVFFAGHGATRELPSGRALGYLVPVNAGLESYQSQAISMTNFQDISEALPAKHVFFVTDACYGGLALTRGAGQNYLREMTRRTARQILTAGGADEQVTDNGPNGHSIFTWTLMQGLEGRGDLNDDGFITASELAAYVGPVVSSVSRQTPAFGSLAGSEGGEFVFQLDHEDEFLSDLSGQLDEEAIRLNAELERLGGAPSAPKAPTAATYNDRGMALFREKKYAEALEAFQQAAALAPSSALMANNVGYMHYKLGQLEQAVRWFEKTILLDPNRGIAYANLGDAYLGLGRTADARRVYEQYLQLQPNAKYADTVRAKLAQLGKGTRWRGSFVGARLSLDEAAPHVSNGAASHLCAPCAPSALYVRGTLRASPGFMAATDPQEFIS